MALPWLITLPSDGSSLERLVANSVRWASEHHAASWFTSKHPPHEAAAALASRLDANLPDGLRVVLRYADARVLLSLVAVLEGAQAQAFFGFASAWWCLDRQMHLISVWDRHLQVMALGQQATERLVNLQFTPAQQAALLEASEPDAVIGLLRQQEENEIDSLPPGPRHALVRWLIGRSREFGVQATADYALLCLVALQHGESFMDEPIWRTALEQVKAGRAKVSDALVGVADTLG